MIVSYLKRLHSAMVALDSNDSNDQVVKHSNHSMTFTPTFVYCTLQLVNDSNGSNDSNGLS